MKKALAILVAKLDLLISLYVILEEERELPHHMVPSNEFKDAWLQALDRASQVQVGPTNATANRSDGAGGVDYGSKCSPDWDERKRTLASMDKIAGRRKFMS